MRPLPPGQDGVDYCKIRRDRNHHHHHHHHHHSNHHSVGGGSSGGTLRRSSASLLEPPSPTERYHGTIEGHYRLHDLALDRYVPPPSPERYSSGVSSASRSYQHHHSQQQHHHHQQQPPEDRYSSSSSSSCHGTAVGTGSGGGGGGRNHYLPVSQSTSESFMSPPSPVAERFDYAARHHDSYTTTAKRNESAYSRYHIPAERFVPIVSPDDGYDGHYDRCDDAAYSSRKEAAALYSRASAIVDAMPSSAAALSRAYATATLRPSNRCCTGPLYSGGSSGGVGGSSGGGGGGCGGYQYGTVGRSRSPRDLSPSGLVRQQAAHLSSTGSPPKGPSNNNNNNNACLQVQYDAHSVASTLPRCSSANVVCAGQNGYDEPAATGYSGSHAATRRISSSCIRESSALACCSTAAYSGHAALSGVKSAAAATSAASSTPSAVAASVAAAAATATSTPSSSAQICGGSGSGNNNNNAHCPPTQPNNASWKPGFTKGLTIQAQTNSRSPPLSITSSPGSIQSSSSTSSGVHSAPPNMESAAERKYDPPFRSMSAPAPSNSQPSSSSTEVTTDNSEETASTCTVPANSSGSDQPNSPPSETVYHPKHIHHQRSLPILSSNMLNKPRTFHRSTSKTEAVKNFIKRETAMFFGLDEEFEETEKLKWLDRRKRLATRKYGELKNEYMNSVNEIPITQISQPDVLQSSRDIDERDSSNRVQPLGRKPSVAKLTLSGLSFVISKTLSRKKKIITPSNEWSRSYPSSVTSDAPTILSQMTDDVFFDRLSSDSGDQGIEQEVVDSGGNYESSIRQHYKKPHQSFRRYSSWQRNPSRRVEDDHMPNIGMGRIWGRVLDRAFDNSDRRQYGMGFIGRVCRRSLNKTVVNRRDVKQQLDDLEDHRPFFTYWVTVVQILVLFLSIFSYGLGPFGIDLSHQSGAVMVTSLSVQIIEYIEPSNFWIGPRAADLIHLGAKFAPCMRKDKNIMKEIEKWREKERETACCIRNDDSGCIQASKEQCTFLIPSHKRLTDKGGGSGGGGGDGDKPPSTSISKWKKWSEVEAGPGGRISGSVCGLDPKYCEAPASIAPFEWPDDITKWPICRKMSGRGSARHSSWGSPLIQKLTSAEHMICEVIGHPCCIGIHGTCRITTREYCDFVHGYFHDDASLCSQVSCLNDVCGLIPFFSPEIPDQFYRLWISLFIHAGILHLATTIVIQYFLMRDLEKLTGSLRIALIYLGSGVAGNLGSAIFVPYRADVGPAGSQFGLLACLIVEVLNCWPMLKRPEQALSKLLAITFLLFLLGLLPWVDNFAHLFGFIFGFLLSYALLPFVSFGPYDRQKKIFLIWVCLLSALFLFFLLLLLFYLIPMYDCEMCSYFNCIPITKDFCANQNINFKNDDYTV
ncbi:inactive rhomboid protein 1 isoform X1 [Aphis gossypii]|uniref:inactive rhomboid protein 1 isoform X1 n=1 Tax=Aphis gossypii TaxID=80765 RepID=UPI002159A641|nr:inactive rhomboid protein 1 isoform X1 [Aphis gossypii]